MFVGLVTFLAVNTGYMITLTFVPGIIILAIALGMTIPYYSSIKSKYARPMRMLSIHAAADLDRADTVRSLAPAGLRTALTSPNLLRLCYAGKLAACILCNLVGLDALTDCRLPVAARAVCSASQQGLYSSPLCALRVGSKHHLCAQASAAPTAGSLPHARVQKFDWLKDLTPEEEHLMHERGWDTEEVGACSSSNSKVLGYLPARCGPAAAVQASRVLSIGRRAMQAQGLLAQQPLRCRLETMLA